jgi:predicted hydrocarbon binding protein
MKKLHFVFATLITAALVLSACAPAVTSQPPPEADVDALETEPAEVEEEAPPIVEEETGLWTQEYITQVPPIMMIDPYFQIFGQSQTAVPYTYENAVKLAGHSCGATAGAWTIARKALEVLYPDGEIPVRGQIAVEAPGAEDEWFVGVFGEVITFVTGASPKTGFIGAEFGQTNDLFVRQNKMDYPDEPTGTAPPQMEWIFTRLDTGAKVGVNFNLAVITPIATPERQEMGKKMAAGTATPEEAADYYEYWNDRAKFVFENADTLEGFFNVKVYQEPTAAPDANIEKSAPVSVEDFAWEQAYITEVPPIMMSEPYFGIFGQTSGPVPYYYEEAVNLAGHSCGATTGAWVITRKALEVLYPNGEVPVRGQIAVEAPGAEDEWFVGVFGEIITFVTGASPHTGFIGSEFGQVNNLFVRQNKMVYKDEPTGQLPPMREWIFTRLDTGAKVGVKFNLVVILPIPTPGRVEMGKKMAAGTATPEEAADYQKYWNDRAIFVLENADMDGFFTVTVYEGEE